MAEPKDEATWFKEFQEVNKAASQPKDSNRRKFPRFEVDGASAALYREGLLTFIGVGKGNLAQTALDLSEGGVRLLLHDRVPPGTKVRVRIKVEKFKDEILATGVVRWCFQNSKKAGEFFAGVMFTDLDGTQLKKLALMKEWFTSPQFKAIRDTRNRQKKNDFIFPK